MKRAMFLAAIVMTAFLFACSKQGDLKLGGQKSSATVAKVGSAVITVEDMNRELKGLPEQIQKMFEGPAGKEKFVEELVKKEILYQEAKKRGLDNAPEYKKKVEDFQKLTLISQLLEKEIEEKVKVSEKDVKDYYDSHRNELTQNGQVKASHILVKTEEEAKKIREQIGKGGDFAKIAREKSIDPGSAANGGDLGYFSRGQMMPEFEKAAFALKTGEVSGPVKTQYGFHIIKVTDRKAGSVVEFDKVKGLLTQKMTAERQKALFDSYINGLRNSYKTEINKEALAKAGGEEAAQPGPQADKPAETPKPEKK